MFAIALWLTLIVEMLVGIVWFRLAKSPVEEGIKLWVWLLGVVAVNLVSHPIAWALNEFLLLEFWTLEIMVVVAEGLLLAILLRYPLKHSLLFSLVANAISAGLGLALFAAIGAAGY